MTRCLIKVMQACFSVIQCTLFSLNKNLRKLLITYFIQSISVDTSEENIVKSL